jgi:hypothetical protein
MCDRDYEKANYAAQQSVGGAMLGTTGNSPYRPSPLREAENDVKHLEEQLSNRKRALEFLAKHPEFGEFIELQRRGCL